MIGRSRILPRADAQPVGRMSDLAQERVERGFRERHARIVLEWMKQKKFLAVQFGIDDEPHASGFVVHERERAQRTSADAQQLEEPVRRRERQTFASERRGDVREIERLRGRRHDEKVVVLPVPQKQILAAAMLSTGSCSSHENDMAISSSSFRSACFPSMR
jgi:hypothetical protein